MQAVLIILAVIAGVIVIGFVVMFGQRLAHNLQRKRETVNTYAIQNQKTGLNIRPYNAGIADGVRVVQYKPANWECMTWQLIRLTDGTVLLKNLYTQKTIQPAEEPASGALLCQQPLEANQYQYWEFIAEGENEFRIQLKDTDLYITADSDENNAVLALRQWMNNPSQRWKLIEQHPIM